MTKTRTPKSRFASQNLASQNPGQNTLELNLTTPQTGPQAFGAKEAPRQQSPNLKVSVVTITPTYARFLLDNKAPNRTLNYNKVSRIANDMRRGKFALNGETIITNRNGQLINGQNRLEACVRSDQDFTTVFVEGVLEDAFETIDTGQSRTAGDILSMHPGGYKNCKQLAAAVRWVETIRRNRLGSPRGSTQLTPEEVCRIVEQEPDIAECVNYIHSNTNLRGVCSASYGGAFFHLIRQIDEEKAWKFIEGLATGANLKEGDPALTVRDYLLRADKRRVNSQEFLAVLIRGWNAFRAGATFNRAAGSVVRDGERRWPKL